MEKGSQVMTWKRLRAAAIGKGYSRQTHGDGSESIRGNGIRVIRWPDRQITRGDVDLSICNLMTVREAARALGIKGHEQRHAR